MTIERGDVPTLGDALARIGCDDLLRAAMVALCRQIESHLARPGFDVRDEVVGPLVDALHRDAGVLNSRLKNGLVFHHRYSGKISRELVLSADAEPDHVWEPQTTRLLLYLARHARHVVVAGAHGGDQALLLAQQLRGTGGVCHCFEPDPDAFGMLRYNAQVNGLEPHMALNPLFLWDDEGAVLHLVGEGACGRPEEVQDGDESAPIGTTTLDAYADRHGIDAFGVLALDVEGGELAILQGGLRFLAQPAGVAPSIVFEVHGAYVDWSNGLETTEIARMLRRCGYHLYAVRDYQSNEPMEGRKIELVDPRGAYLEGPVHGFNMLAVKDESLVRTPLFRHCSGVSPKLLRHRDPRLHQPLDP